MSIHHDMTTCGPLVRHRKTMGAFLRQNQGWPGELVPGCESCQVTTVKTAPSCDNRFVIEERHKAATYFQCGRILRLGQTWWKISCNLIRASGLWGTYRREGFKLHINMFKTFFIACSLERWTSRKISLKRADEHRSQGRWGNLSYHVS